MSAIFRGPLEIATFFLTITQAGQGGVAGKSPTVALRDDATDDFLDFADNTFKGAGWTTKDQALTDMSGGHYKHSLDLSLISAKAGDVYVAEFKVDDGGAVRGAAHDFYLIEDLPIMRKIMTNRLEESAGNPGLLRLYDDDGTTLLRTWELRDASGGAITAAVGAPARRTNP